MKILILGNGVMANILKDSINEENVFVEMLDTKLDLKTDKEFDIIIDFSNANATKKVIDFAVEKNKPILIATTGQNKEQMEYIKKAAEKIAILKVSNTSYGVITVKKLLKEANKYLKDSEVEIVEMHHNRKKDKPSGTAISLANTLEKENIPIHSIRAANIFGEHSVYFFLEDETIEIKHTANSRKIFAIGAIKMAKKILNIEKGYYEE